MTPYLVLLDSPLPSHAEGCDGTYLSGQEMPRSSGSHPILKVICRGRNPLEMKEAKFASAVAASSRAPVRVYFPEVTAVCRLLPHRARVGLCGPRQQPSCRPVTATLALWRDRSFCPDALSGSGSLSEHSHRTVWMAYPRLF